jgi:fatty-acyl-CoA synthase
VLANTPAMLECHYGVPMAGAVLNTINTRLDAAVIAFQLDHAETKVLITDREFSKVVKDALALAKVKPLVVDYDDPEFTGAGERLGTIEYEDFVKAGDPDFAWKMPDDEWDAISLNYTRAPPAIPRAWSITIAAPTCWRSATCYRQPRQALRLSLDAADVPLQWLVLSVDDLGGGRHPCVPAPGACAGDVRRHCRHKVTHLCGAPIVMATLLKARRREESRCRTWSSSSPRRRRRPEAVLAAMKEAGFNVTHVYGLDRNLWAGEHATNGTQLGRAAPRRAGGQEGAPGRALRAARGARRARTRTRLRRSPWTARAWARSCSAATS